jgi:hypothetical protein
LDRTITYVGFVWIQRSREHRVTITTAWISIEINRVYRFDNRSERNEFVRERLLSRMSVCRKCAHAVPGRRRKNELEREYEELWNEA